MKGWSIPNAAVHVNYAPIKKAIVWCRGGFPPPGGYGGGKGGSGGSGGFGGDSARAPLASQKFSDHPTVPAAN